MLEVFFDHFVLGLICGMFLCLTEMTVDIFKERWELSKLEFDFQAIFFDDLFWRTYGCDFDSKLCLTVFGESIVFGLDSFLNQDIFDFFCLTWSDVAWIVPRCSMFICKINKCVRCFCVKYLFIYSWIDLLELLWEWWPVWCRKEKLSEGLFGTLGDKFSVPERFVVTTVVNYCRQVHQDLLNRLFIEFAVECVYCLLRTFFEGFEDEVE